ncbi:uncharacterized protein LOC106693245 [Microplitis demolitor]|uniref:uncharacterized protein LOC106693245 n=1 Tax=Microplitis demolitor TaxID=69319 RepID=UPI00235B5E3D|nr:uncharacterized protein LOC106693245 [Microplitis demolitor]
MIDDIDEELERRKEEVAVLGKTKIFIKKFADDQTLVAERPEELQRMLKTMAKYMAKNKLEINANKSKVMICRKGGRKSKKERWSINEQQLQTVENYKYLGYWINARVQPGKHVMEMARKTQKAINCTWGIIKRAKIKGLKRRLYLYDTLARAGGLFGVEIWAWRERQQVERVQNKIYLETGSRKDERGNRGEEKDSKIPDGSIKNGEIDGQEDAYKTK